MLSLSFLHRLPPKPSFPSLSAFYPRKPSPPQSLLLTSTHSFLSLRIRSISPTATATATATPKPNSLCPTQMLSSNSHLLKIAIIGFGNYGQFLAKTLVSQGHTVLAHSRTDHSLEAHSLGVSFFLDPHDFCEQHPDVILLCTSIISTEEVLKSLPLHRFKRNTLFVDVLSVKEFAKNLLLDVLPSDFDIICTHPMFGPQSANLGWDDLQFVYENVRIGKEKSRIDRCKRFLDIFSREGCKMLEMSCQDQDKHAAGSQC